VLKGDPPPVGASFLHGTGDEQHAFPKAIAYSKCAGLSIATLLVKVSHHEQLLAQHLARETDWPAPRRKN
jgi:hypothetical protein